MEWLTKLFSKKPSSKDIARDKLKLVLIHDRVNCSTQLLEMLKNDIFKVLTKYMDIDETELDLQISQEQEENGGGPVPVLYANIPIKNMRKQRT